MGALRVTVSFVCAMCVQGIFRSEMQINASGPKVFKGLKANAVRTRAGIDSQGDQTIEESAKYDWQSWKSAPLDVAKTFNIKNCGKSSFVESDLEQDAAEEIDSFGTVSSTGNHQQLAASGKRSGEIVESGAKLKVKSSGQVKARMAEGTYRWVEAHGKVTIAANLSKTVSKSWKKKEQMKIPVAPIGYLVVGYDASLTITGTVWISVSATFDFKLCFWYKRFSKRYGACESDDTDMGKAKNSSFNKKISYEASVTITGKATAFVGVEVGPAAVALTPLVKGTLTIGKKACTGSMRYSLGVKLGPTVMYWINKALAATCLNTLKALELTLWSKENAYSVKCPTGLKLKR